MYEVKTFEEVTLDISLGQLKYLIDGPSIVKNIKEEIHEEEHNHHHSKKVKCKKHRRLQGGGTLM